jgi:hypothetical protein
VAEEEKGLYGKYRIYHDDGIPVDPKGMYFVLKLNAKDPRVAWAARQATRAYAYHIESFQPTLAVHLRLLADDLDKREPN